MMRTARHTLALSGNACLGGTGLAPTLVAPGAGIVMMKPNSVTNRSRRLVLLAFIAGSTIVTQEFVSASVTVVERSNQTDSMLVALANTVNTVHGSIGRLAGVGDARRNCS